ncbi:Toxin YoeB [termite gut metagenome]|uniref:Putative mRNA interferase YoeB n=1 Tax=termite gut metagenome TaxID=433724 RepID=A0A5J4QH58_9ZZZZ
MIYKVFLADEANKQLLTYKKSGAKKDILKIYEFLEELRIHPTSGTGKVEQLKSNYKGYWSRRVNKQYRILYTIDEERFIVEVASVRSHYGEK